MYKEDSSVHFDSYRIFFLSFIWQLNFNLLILHRACEWKLFE